MEQSQKSSGSVILSRVAMLGEELIPGEVLDQMNLPNGSLDIFLTVPDPDQWPAEMQPLRQWIEENVPPEYWAEFEDDEE